MKILEVKNGLVKISYETDENLALGGFIIIEDANTPFVGQIVNLKADSGLNFAVLKLLFTFNNEGILKSYDGTIPSTNAKLTKLPASELLAVLPSETPITIGVISGEETPFKLDTEALNSNLLICSDNIESTSAILNNFIPQIAQTEKKAVLIDVNGDFLSENSFVFGKNFKLPLNGEFLDFIFEHDLDGVEPVSKAVIQDIFAEVKEYVTSLPEGYLPIGLFIDVVQQQYIETLIPELVLLKNRLLKYKEENVFADEKENIHILRDKIAHSDSLVIDISSADTPLKKKLVEFIYDGISTVNADTLVFITVDNDLADKKLLRKTLEYQNVCSTIICSHSFKYLPDLKQIIQNLILFTPQTIQHDFAAYNTFLNKLNRDEFIVYGASTQNIPFMVKLVNWEDILEAEKEQQDNNEETSNEISEEKDEISNEEDSIFDTDENNVFSDMPEQLPNAQEETVTPDVLEDVALTVGNNTDENTEEIEPAMQVEPTFEEEALNDRTELEEDVAKDVEASFYKNINEDTPDIENDVNPEIFEDLSSEEVLSDEDLDYIQSMPSDDETQEAYQPEDFDELQEPQSEDEILTDDAIDDFNTNSDADNIDDTPEFVQDPNLPVYTPPQFDTGVVDTAPKFGTGDIVSHPKYGQGVVEKMINYGNKTLCSISFVNIGRRLLDPTVSELVLVEHGAQA